MLGFHFRLLRYNKSWLKKYIIHYTNNNNLLVESEVGVAAAGHCLTPHSSQQKIKSARQVERGALRRPRRRNNKGPDNSPTQSTFKSARDSAR